MTERKQNQVGTAADSVDDTEAAGGEDIYGADGDAGTVRAENQETDADDDNATDAAGGTEPAQL